jgi:hypothetical protein
MPTDARALSMALRNLGLSEADIVNFLALPEKPEGLLLEEAPEETTEVALTRRAALVLPKVIVQEIFKFADFSTIFNCESIHFAAVEARKYRRADVTLAESAKGPMFTTYEVSPW